MLLKNFIKEKREEAKLLLEDIRDAMKLLDILDKIKGILNKYSYKNEILLINLVQRQSIKISKSSSL